jgi:hypothetical protein
MKRSSHFTLCSRNYDRRRFNLITIKWKLHFNFLTAYHSGCAVLSLNVFARLNNAIVGSNPTRSIRLFAFLLCLCCPVCRYQACDGLILRPRGPTNCLRLILNENRPDSLTRRHTVCAEESAWRPTVPLSQVLSSFLGIGVNQHYTESFPVPVLNYSGQVWGIAAPGYIKNLQRVPRKRTSKLPNTTVTRTLQRTQLWNSLDALPWICTPGIWSIRDRHNDNMTRCVCLLQPLPTQHTKVQRTSVRHTLRRQPYGRKALCKSDSISHRRMEFGSMLKKE